MEDSCFAVNACVPMVVAHFEHCFIPKGDGIKYIYISLALAKLNQGYTELGLFFLV